VNVGTGYSSMEIKYRIYDKLPSIIRQFSSIHRVFLSIQPSA
jgi:hypothetical protein